LPGWRSLRSQLNCYDTRYEEVNPSQSQFDGRLFQDSHVVWSDMRSGFEHVVAQYLDAWNWNKLRSLCVPRWRFGEDRELLRRAGDKMDPDSWEPRKLYDRCRQWAAD
jgi:hypothetical protein